MVATDYGRGLRRIVKETSALARVVDFADFQLFEGATNYVAIVSLARSPRSTFVYADASTGSIGPERQVLVQSLPENSELSWSFGSPEDLVLLNRLLSGFRPLAKLRDRAFQGLRTSDNDVYVVESRTAANRGLMKIYSSATGHEHEIEADILKPFVSGEQIRAFRIEHTDRWILFPYEIATAPRLLTKRELERNYPFAWSYLRACERRLRSRERGVMDNEQWWAFGRTQNIDAFEQPKIMLPGFNDSPAAGLDMAGEYYNASGYSVTLRADAPMKLSHLVALLNSRVHFWVLRRVGVALQRGVVEFRPQYLDRLPIAELSDEQKLQLTSMAHEGAERGFETVRDRLNDIVAEIYGLSEEERRIIET